MPYRRLPNTDAARIKAMKTALEKGNELPPHKLAYSSKTFVRLQKLFSQFENNIHLYRQSLNNQNKKNKDYYDTARKARIYLTHFIRVLNMAIFRGELPASTRTYFGLSANDSTVPSLNTENELVSWGKRIIEGEEFRIRKGGSPITNPTIAVVKVWFGKFLDAIQYNNTLSKRTREYIEKNIDLRKEADDIILNLWNEVESSFAETGDKEKRKKCENYGLVYFFRKGEVENAGAIELRQELRG